MSTLSIALAVVAVVAVAALIVASISMDRVEGIYNELASIRMELARLRNLRNKTEGY